MRTADHHFLVDLDGKLRLTDARMDELRCDDIQDRLMDTSRTLHLRDFIGTFPKAQILHDIIQRQRRFKRKMLMKKLHPVQRGLLRFHIDHLRDMRIKSRRLAEASHRADITEVRLIRSAHEISPHPQDRIRRSDDERSLLHRPREIVHRYLVTDDRHLPVRMTRIHEFPKFFQPLFQLLCRDRTDRIRQNGRLLQNCHISSFCLTNPYLTYYDCSKDDFSPQGDPCCLHGK